MVNEEPKIPDNARFSVCETAKILDISTSTLWRHTTAQLIKCERFRANGRPRYKGSEIKKYWKQTY